MNEMFQAEGVVYCKNTGLTDSGDIRALMLLIHQETMWYQAGANNRPQLVGQQNNVYETGAPMPAHVHYHHEMAYVNESCRWLGFMGLERTNDPMKGASYIAHNKRCTEELLATDFGQKLKEKGVCYVRKLPDLKYFDDNNLDKSIVYNYWQTSMGTHDMDEAQEVAERSGLTVDWEESPVFGRYMVTKFYVDCFEYCPFTKKNLLYASVADDYMWFDQWPGVVTLPHHERPLKLNFGDDTIMTREEKQTFVDVYDNNGHPLVWERGDFAVICNFRTAHGRPGITLDQGEKRELGVVLGTTFTRQGSLPDAW
jgi:hypothetical protein